MAAKSAKTFLSFLSELTLRQLKPVLATLSKSQILAIREIAVNALNGNLDIDSETLKKLFPFKKFLREFAYRGVRRCVLSKRCKAVYLLLKSVKDILEKL